MRERILVVEGADSVRSGSSFGAVIAGQGYFVESMSECAEAFAHLAEAPPDLVILDVRGARSADIEWCRRIKGDSATRDVKVIVVTSTGAWSRVFEAFAAGCDDYLVEPFDRAELTLKMKDLLKFSHLRRDIDRAAMSGRL